MLYIPTKAEKQQASDFLSSLREEWPEATEKLSLEELLAMYAKEIR
jgi:hypothetical protein